MRIGFTERGDAGIDLTWKNKLLGANTCQGAVLITKNITDGFRDAVLELVENDFPFIVHATVTGWGGSEFEPNVPDYETEIARLNELIMRTFKPSAFVLRIDPVFPTEKGLKKVGEVLEYAKASGLIGGPLNIRVRISIYDEYPHVRERLKAVGKEPLYKGSFYAPHKLMLDAAETLARYSKEYGVTFETCAEPTLTSLAPSGVFKETGCLSLEDIKRMKLPTDEAEKAAVNLQNRNGCKCLGFKYELLTRRNPCPNGCLYCYWKDAEERYRVRDLANEQSAINLER